MKKEKKPGEESDRDIGGMMGGVGAGGGPHGSTPKNLPSEEALTQGKKKR